MKFTAEEIWADYERNLDWAKRALRRLPAYCGTEPKFRGLNGWVFEQVVQSCLRTELKSLRVRCEICEQVRLGAGRSQADLRLGRVLLEIKLSGAYGTDSLEKYRPLVQRAKSSGGTYLYFSGEESYPPNRSLAVKIFGRGNVFYLDDDEDWAAFVNRVATRL